jgi:hypothetical protein
LPPMPKLTTQPCVFNSAKEPKFLANRRQRLAPLGDAELCLAK